MIRKKFLRTNIFIGILCLLIFYFISLHTRFTGPVYACLYAPEVAIQVKDENNNGVTANELCSTSCLESPCVTIQCEQNRRKATFKQGNIGDDQTGGRINDSNLVVIGVTPDRPNQGIELPDCNGASLGYCYVWNQGSWCNPRDIIFIVAIQTATPTPTSTPTPTPTPFQTVSFRNPQLAAYGQNVCNAAWNCGTTTGTTANCAVRSNYQVAILQTNTCSGVRTPSYIYADLLGVTPAPSALYRSNSDANNSFYGWPVWYTGGKTATFVWAYNIYGWVYTEEDNDTSTRGASEDLIGNYTLNLTGDKTDSVNSQSSAINELNANYILNKITQGIYRVELPITPTGSILWPGYTNPQSVIVVDSPINVGFPFVSITPTVSPTSTPTPTPTPTGVPNPPTPLPTEACIISPLPTPLLVTPYPPHQLCTNIKPTVFSAYVEDPNNNYVWANFFSNDYETFDKMGSIQPNTGGVSQWTPDGSILNSTGSYRWSVYTKDPSCPKSADTPSLILDMDYQAPPDPTPPTCSLQSQNYVTGLCIFDCSWPADPDTAPISCSQAVNYHPQFTYDPGPGGTDPGWLGNQLLYTLEDVPDGQNVRTKLSVADSLNNTSISSNDGGPFVCPKINKIISITQTPITPTLTPTITPSPTPGDWIQVLGGDVYQNSIPLDIPSGQKYLDNITSPSMNNSSGVILSNTGSSGLGDRSSPTKWEAEAGNLSTTYSFPYYWEAFKSKAIPVDNQTAGVIGAGNLDQDNVKNAIYVYFGKGLYTLDPSFKGRISGVADVTIFLISGTLEIPDNATHTYDLQDPNDIVVYMVNGNIFINGQITQASGLFISSQTVTIDSGSSAIIFDGMLVANKFVKRRTFRNPNSPAYQFIYQPKYIIGLLPFIGRTQINWQEIAP